MLRSERLRVTTVAAAFLVALVAVLVLWGTRPAEAAFPGKNGKISFTHVDSCGSSGCEGEIYSANPLYAAIPGGPNPPNPLTNNKVRDNSPAWSPNGKKIAFSRARDLYTMKANGSDVTRLTTTTATESGPAFSPDGKKLAFVANSDLYTMKVSRPEEPPQRLTTIADAFDPAWSPDGTKIAFWSFTRDEDSEIYVMKAAPEGPTNPAVNLTDNTVADSYPDWSPNGKKIVFVSRRDGNSEIYRMDSDGSDPLRLTTTRAEESYPAYSPTGTKIAFSFKGEIYIMDFDGTDRVRQTKNNRVDNEPDWQPLP